MLWLFLAFVGVPIIEIALFIQLGNAIGLGFTLGIVILTAILGTWLVRTQGVQAISRLQQALNRLDNPAEPLADGAMILVAGVLLLTPGFLTDTIGFSLLMPPVRRTVFLWLRARIRVQSFSMGPNPDAANNARGFRNADVIDGEFQEVEPPKRPTHSVSESTKH